MQNKHNPWDLEQMQALSLNSKVIMTQQRIKAWYEYFDGNVYVSRSGGKDSDVLGDIVKKMYPDVPQVFVNTGLEYTSVREHATDICDTVLRPEMNFVEVIKKYGYPIISKEVAQTLYEVKNRIEKGLDAASYRMDKLNGTLIDKNTGKLSSYNMPKYKYLIEAPFRISHKCCDVMKKNPAKKYEKETGQKCFIGTMAAESRLRRTKWMQHGCNAFETERPTSKPLSFWTEQDILQYILENDIKIAGAYGDIVYTDDDGMQYEDKLFDDTMALTTTKAKRTGCVFCMFGIGHDKERFLRLKEEEPQLYDYVMRGGKFDDKGMWVPYNGLGYKFVIDWLNEHGKLNIMY